MAGQVAGEVDLDEEENAQKIFKEKEAYNREKAKKRRATIAKIKRVKELKAKKSIQAIEPKKEEVGEIGRQILTLKKKNKTHNSEPSGIPKTKNSPKETGGPPLKIKKKKKLMMKPDQNVSQ